MSNAKALADLLWSENKIPPVLNAAKSSATLNSQQSAHFVNDWLIRRGVAPLDVGQCTEAQALQILRVCSDTIVLAEAQFAKVESLEMRIAKAEVG